MHAEQGLDVVRLNPGFVCGPGGLLRSASVHQARKGRLRCISTGSNWWSCVHVDDLGRPLVASLVTSFRVDASLIRAELGWQPGHPSFRESGPAAVRALAS